MILQGKKTLIGICIALLITNAVFAWRYATVAAHLEAVNATAGTAVFNERVLEFAGLFIDKVLKAKQEVSFEDRLNLETVVRNLKDDQILEQWNKFVNSKTETEAQEEVKNLLDLLVKKIRR